jgi:hypothetical protein
LFTNDSSVENAGTIINLQNGNGLLYVTYALSPAILLTIKTYMMMIINPLTPELNPSAQLCLPRYLIFKGFNARRLYKSFAVKGLIQRWEELCWNNGGLL